MENLALRFIETFLDLYLDTAIWLLAGLTLAAVLKGVLPNSLIQRWLGGQGVAPVIRGALIGAPLPLCSCGVLPAAIGLHRAGASRPATTSFLIATPETGVDSIAVSYALLGPVMAIIRPIAAILSAITTGILVLAANKQPTTALPASEPHSETSGGCCSSGKSESGSSCCATAGDKSSCCDTTAKSGPLYRFYDALIDLLDDIKVWLLFGLVLAALFGTLVEPSALGEFGTSIWAMLLMLMISLPLYICATASTPIAAVMLWSGISPGAVLVFMLVGPATNIGAIGLLIRELGLRTVLLYLTGIVVTALAIGWGVNLLFTTESLSLPPLGERSQTSLWIQASAAVLLSALMIAPLRRLVVHEPSNNCCS